MNINLRALALATLVFVTADKINAQNIFPANGSVGIGTTSPNASAILDISSTTKGMLAPRMTKAQRDAIATPATGLLIFQTNGTPGLYIYSGTAWVPVSGAGANTSLSNLNATTKVNASLVPDSNKVRNLGSSGLSWKNIYYNGSIYSGNNRILNGDIVNANTSIGYYSGALNTTGAFNTASGYAALYANTSGSNNTASGNYALTTNTTGGSNTSTGAFSLYQNTTGSSNVAFGINALYSNTSANYNTAFGSYTLRNATGTGSDNTAVGAFALDANTTGAQNTGLGYEAGQANQTGYNNTSIGAVSGLTNSTDNSMCLGYLAGNTYGASNSVTCGNSSVSFMVAQVQWSSFSDRRIKDNIKENVPGLAFINKLKPVTYNLNIHREDAMLNKGKQPLNDWRGRYDIEKKLMTGFVAQDVEQAAAETGYEFSGIHKPETADGLYSITYSEFVVPLVKAVQELSKLNDAQKNAITDLQNANSSLEQRVSKLEAMLNGQTSATASSSQQAINITGVSLEQNIPNPLKSATIINYSLPEKYTSAQIVITDKSGKAIKQATVSGSGKGTLNVDAAMLLPGTYHYSLYVNGKFFGSRQMVVIK